MFEKTCAVVGCESGKEELFEYQAGPPAYTKSVCRDHGLALRAGEAFMIDTESGGILIGSDVPPEVIDIRWRQSVGPVELLTFDVGRHGVKEDEFTIRITPDLKDKLANPFIVEVLRRAAEDH